MNFLKAVCLATPLWAALGLQTAAYAEGVAGKDGVVLPPSGKWTGAVPIPVPTSQPWGIEQLNDAIDSANVIVDNRCSGTLVSLSPPRVLTNYHCVEHKISTREREETNADGVVKKVKREWLDPVSITQKSYNDQAVRVGSSEYMTKIVAHQKTRDLALLQVLGRIPNGIAIKVQSAGGTVSRGETVYSVGNPNMLDASLNKGVVSSVTRRFEFSWAHNVPLRMIQFSGGIAGGSSGGSLLNVRGELIGVPAAGYRGSSFLGFAIPADVVRKFLLDHCQGSVLGNKADDAACRKAKEKKNKKPAENG